MNELLARIIDAHGGMDRCKEFEKVDATIVSGGGLFALKDVTQDPNPRRMTVWLHEERRRRLASPKNCSTRRTFARLASEPGIRSVQINRSPSNL
jgi:hypothetical protein